VLCTQTPGGVTEDEFTELLLERGVSGIVFVSGLHADSAADPSRYVKLVERGVPLVMINGFISGVAAPFISTDDREATRLAVTHLVELGHEKIGLSIGHRRYVPVIRKIEGFSKYMRERLGVRDVSKLVEHTLFTVEGGHAAAVSLVERGCTAIICGSDMMALGAIRGVRAMGLNVPKDVSVVGFDDSPLIGFTDPPLTTIRQPVEAMGIAAVRALLDESDGVPAPGSELLFRPELVVRGSTGSGPRITR
jgi:DNA-binding LacI/PurR family transcriptional regulator